MEFFNFEPNEFQVLEDIEFDETIQRPEKVRFFTVTEQTTDAYEKLMPRGRVTRFQREEVRKQIERLQELYNEYVVVLPEEYKLREPSYGKQFNWIHPVYADDEYKQYNWYSQMTPLFDNPTLPGFYPRLLDALPRPYADTSEGLPYLVDKPTTFVNKEGNGQWRVLPEYVMTRTQRHEDKTIDVVKVPVTGTEDVVRFKGYYLDKRPLDIPNPLLEHPFLKSNEPTFVESSAPLKDVVPSLDAILTHAVPVTKDPYVEGTQYLKLYDVRLKDIPWSAWTSKFPPVDMINEAPRGEPIAYPKPAQLAPPENVIEAYKSSYSPGVSVRLWLMNQLDGGGLIQRLLLSKAIDNGSVESVPGVDLEQAAYPDTTMDECALTGKSWNDFLITGTLRRTIIFDSKDKDKFTIKYQCVPLEFIKQERARVGYLNRKPWAETTGDDMKKEYVLRLEEIRPVGGLKEKAEVLPKTPQRPDSQRRAEVLAILDDPRRFADDKLRDINEIVRGITPTKNIYKDPDDLFILCAHTLSLLGGDLESDRLKYYETWTARENGFRVCKFCGERINTDDYVDQVQFDEDGMVIRRTEAFEDNTFHGAGVRSFAKGLESLRPLFLDGNAHDDMVLLLLTVLQVLPTADKLEPLLKFGRSVAGAQFSKGTEENVAKFTGFTGIATTALILQTHIPTLIPRRSFGSKPLPLAGYPRDADKPDEYGIADAMNLVIRSTFEAFPTSFKGPAKQAIRAVLNKPGEVKTSVNNLLSAKSPLIKGLDKLPSPVPELLAKAKAYRAENPIKVEVPKTLIPTMMAPKTKVEIPVPECPSSRPIWTSGRLPQIIQAPIQLGNGIHRAPNAKPLTKTESSRILVGELSKEDIRAGLAREKGLQTRIPIRDTPIANLSVASRLSDMFFLKEPVRAVQPTRDTSRAILADTLAEIQKDTVKRTRLEEQRNKDIALYTLTANYKEEKANANRLVAAERIKFVERMARKSDAEREVIQDLLKIGLAPYVITRADREELAREAQRLRDEVYRDEELVQEVDIEVGVGQPRDVFEQGEEGAAGVDNGDYGDYVGMPGNDGRDHEQPQITDDQQRSI